MVDAISAKIEYITTAIKATYGEIARMELLKKADRTLLDEIPDNGEKEKLTKEANARLNSYDTGIREGEESIANMEELLIEYQQDATGTKKKDTGGGGGGGNK